LATSTDTRPRDLNRFKGLHAWCSHPATPLTQEATSKLDTFHVGARLLNFVLHLQENIQKMTGSSSASTTSDRMFYQIGGALSVLAGVLQAYFLYQSLALILQFGMYDLVFENLLVLSPQILGMLLSLGGGLAVLARLHWGWPMAVGAAGFQLAMFAQLTAMYGMQAMTALIDQAAYVIGSTLLLCAALMLVLCLRPSTQALQVRVPHVLTMFAVAASLLLVWNMIQESLF
jgi:hypothetical protein